MRFPGLAFLSQRAAALASAGLVFALLLACGEVILQAQLLERASKRQIDTISYATTLRVRLERELNSVLYLNSGLGAYLIVRNKDLQADELQDILAVLHRNNPLIRNFGVAVGYRLLHVYPLRGNERAIGLYYPDQPAQWPMIQQIVRSGQPALAGPVDLVQGGRGLVYRMPLSRQGRYWGLLSTVIDADRLLQRVQAESDGEHYEFAVRGQDAKGLSGGPVWGSLALFDQPGVQVQEMEVPGGRWAIAVRDRVADDARGLRWLIRSTFLAGGLLVAAMLYMLIRSRGRMALHAMYDGLTGLPNRRLFEDRALMAFSRQQRQPDQLCALLFMDLDDFKTVNDQHGHKAGDAVLMAVANRALAAVRQNDTVARWGGDEFIILLENISRDMLETIAYRLRSSIQEPIPVEGRSLQVGVSIGVAIYPDAGTNLDELLHAADGQMYGDKIARKARFDQPSALAE